MQSPHLLLEYEGKLEEILRAIGGSNNGSSSVTNNSNWNSAANSSNIGNVVQTRQTAI